MRKKLLALAVSLTLLYLTGHSSQVSAQTITTCQAVGCFGGSPGCYWYWRDGTLDGGIGFCYGRR